MKMIRVIEAAFVLALAALPAVSCDKFRDTENVTNTRARGTLTVQLSFPDGMKPSTRVDAYTDTEDSELTVSSISVLIYGYSETKQSYVLENCLHPDSFGAPLTAQLLPGDKKVGVIVSEDSASPAAGLAAYADFEAYRYDIRAFESSAAGYFQMAGEAACTVTAGGKTTCGIAVSHICARVTLAQVTNATSSSITLKRAFLSNVARYYTASDGDATPAADFLNIQGRSDRNQSHIIDGSTCQAAMKGWTYSDGIAQTLSAGGSATGRTFFYCYPNRSTAAPDGYTSTYGGECTTLVVVASVGGTDYYYPIVLDPDEMGQTCSVERNKAYTIALTITGPGSDDPNKPVTKSAASFTVSIADWSAGPVYDQSI